ncbi:MAG: hypothetical protein QOK31_1095 [Solirubrobacteraceae bacterium]|nr:hypothetical protein [Solirubrobacteraceae bacterium]
MAHVGRRRGGRHGTCALALVLAGALAGCQSSHSFSGHSGTCRYGLGAGNSGLNCYRRTQPDDALRRQAMSSGPLARGLAAWRAAHGSSVVNSVGIDAWAETTVTVGEGSSKRLTTYAVDGRPTHGDDGYVSSAKDPFRIAAARPGVFGRLLSRIAAGQPNTRLAQAVLDVYPFHPFSQVLAWRIDVIAPKSGGDIGYIAGADGRGLCHGANYTKSALAPAPGVPACPGNILPF